MSEDWADAFMRKMRCEKVTFKTLGEEMGYTKEYAWMILHGKRKPKDIRHRMETAFEAVLAKRDGGAE